MLGYLPADISVPRSEQFPESVIRGKFWASKHRWCLRQIYPSIFSHLMGLLCLYPLLIFENITRMSLGLSWGIFSHMMLLDQSRANEVIWWVICWKFFHSQRLRDTIDNNLHHLQYAEELTSKIKLIRNVCAWKTEVIRSNKKPNLNTNNDTDMRRNNWLQRTLGARLCAFRLVCEIHQVVFIFFE